MKTVEPVSVTVVPPPPPVRVTWYLETPLLSVDGSQVRTTETPSALALTSVGAVGASVSGSSAAQGSVAPLTTVRFLTVLVPVAIV